MPKKASKTLKRPVVLKVKDPVIKQPRELHPNLMELPSCLLICGAVKQGKSNYLLNLLANDDFIGSDFFDQYKIISTTLNADPKGKIFNDLFDCEDTYSDQMIKDLIESQKKYGDKTDMPSTCLIADDILTKEFVRKNTDLTLLSSRFRHFNIQLLAYVTQSFKAIPPIVRNNATDIIVMKQSNAKELEKIAEEYSPMFGDDKIFKQLYDYAIGYGPYNFLYLKLSQNPAEAFRCHEEKIAEGSKILFNKNSKNNEENNIE